MAVNDSQTGEWIVDSGTPRHSQQDESEFEDLFKEDDEEPEESIADKFLKLVRPARKSRGITLGGLQRTRVTVVAPGAGVGMNGKVYAEMKQDPSLQLRVEGRSGMPYDRYPTAWPQGGAPPPNLESFAQGVMAQGVIQDTDCFVFGSRGGQIVLTTLWKALQDGVPPAVVINGGCAIDMPITVHWPTTAVTLLILGGNDYFKKPHFSPQQFVADAQNRVSKSNSTTAILFVQEMAHMPPPQLLATILKPAISGLLSWKATGKAPTDCFEMIARSVKSIGMSARLLYTSAPGVWQEVGCAPGLATAPAAPTASMIRPAMPQTLPAMPASRALVGQPGMPLMPGPASQPVAGAPQPMLVQQSPVLQMGARTATLPAAGPSPVMFPSGARPVMLPAGASPVMLPPGTVLRR